MSATDRDRERARAYLNDPPAAPHGHGWTAITCPRCYNTLAAAFAAVREEQREADAKVADAQSGQNVANIDAAHARGVREGLATALHEVATLRVALNTEQAGERREVVARIRALIAELGGKP